VALVNPRARGALSRAEHGRLPNDNDSRAL
jgi:hypothetical protein